MNVLEEAIEEAVGGSSKRWGLIVVALVIGGIVAMLLAKRVRATSPTEDWSQTREPSGAPTQPG